MKNKSQRITQLLAENVKLPILCFFGILFGLPFAFPKAFIISWFACVPLFCKLLNRNMTLKRVFCSLFCFFYFFYVCLYHWFVNLYPLDFAGLGNFQSVLVILCAVLLIPAVHTCIMSLCMLVGFGLGRRNKVLLCLALTFSYALGEYLQGCGILAFPWGRLFVSQMSFLPVLQSASLFGSYFITILIVLVNCLLALALVTESSKRIIYGSLAVCVFIFNAVFGIVRLYTYSDSEKTIHASALQGNMTSQEKWSDGVISTSLKRYVGLVEMSEKYSGEKKTDLYVIPETAFPVTISLDKNTGEAKAVDESLKQWSQSTGAYILSGAFYEEDGKSYNSLFLYSPDGSVSYPYNKQHIVPFGEFLPFRNVLEAIAPSFADLNLFGDDLTQGKTPQTFETSFGKMGALVCFDSVFPELCRKQVANGARIIAVSTNDSWYKRSAALRQHASHSQMRAIENNVSVVRAANTGISMVISPTGEIVDSLGAEKYGTAQGNVPVTKSVTLYTRIGDAVLYLGIGFLLVLAVLKFAKKQKRGC